MGWKIIKVFIAAYLALASGNTSTEEVGLDALKNAVEVNVPEGAEQEERCRKPKPTKPCCTKPTTCPTLCSARTYFQNYLDINVTILEHYNFQTSFPDVGVNWQLTAPPPDTSYSNGVFASLGSNVYIEELSNFSIGSEETVYMTAQYTFSNTNDVATALGADEDPFYGCGLVSMIDTVTTGFQFAFVLTNTMVYAMYSRDPALRTPSNNYFAFTYLVPISARQSGDHNVYTIGLNRMSATITWLINGMVKMQVLRPGSPIDIRFATSNLGGVIPPIIFPTQMRPLMGIFTFTVADSQTACQQTLFNYCDRSVSITNAANSLCVYAPLPVPATYNVDLIMEIDLFSITRASALEPACCV